jgi:hypothetical protein
MSYFFIFLMVMSEPVRPESPEKTTDLWTPVMCWLGSEPLISFELF